MKKYKEIIKKFKRNCVCCDKEIGVVLYSDRSYKGGHYFGKLLKNAEYWECNRCYGKA